MDLHSNSQLNISVIKQDSRQLERSLEAMVGQIRNPELLNLSKNIFDSKLLFNDNSRRFQYYQRVFTHFSVNKYLIVTNINKKVHHRSNVLGAQSNYQESLLHNINTNNLTLQNLEHSTIKSNILQNRQSDSNWKLSSPKVQNIQVIPVNSSQEDVQLRHFVPY